MPESPAAATRISSGHLFQGSFQGWWREPWVPDQIDPAIFGGQPHPSIPVNRRRFGKTMWESQQLRGTFVPTTKSPESFRPCTVSGTGTQNSNVSVPPSVSQNPRRSLFITEERNSSAQPGHSLLTFSNRSPSCQKPPGVRKQGLRPAFLPASWRHEPFPRLSDSSSLIVVCQGASPTLEEGAHF